MNKELITKINRCNLPREEKKQLIESLNKGDLEGLLKRIFYISSISEKACNYFGIDLKDFF
jgi:hypothetical protein